MTVISNETPNVDVLTIIPNDANSNTADQHKRITELFLAISRETIDCVKRAVRIICHSSGKFLHVSFLYTRARISHCFHAMNSSKKAGDNREDQKTWNKFWNDPKLSWNKFCHNPAVEIQSKNDSKGLIVLIHGLLDHPVNWTKQIKCIQQSEVSVDLFVPFVPKVGMCDLEQATDPIFKRIQEYTLANPDKKITIISHSNGGRIASALASKLPNTPMMLSSIAGVFSGSPVAGFFDRNVMHYKYIPTDLKNIAEELAEDSKKANSITEGLKNIEATAERNFVFYATKNDCLVPEKSARPVVGTLKAKYETLSGYGHTSITEAVADKQVKNIMQWMGS
jgi:hypothetical protein